MAEPFDPAAFRKMFPHFADTTKYPDELLSGYYDSATCFVYPESWRMLHGKCLQRALYLLVAHLGGLGDQIKAGVITSGIQTGATVDKVSVTIQAPPATTGWKFWLSTTPWGLELWALLSVKSAGGVYVGGSRERQGFRKAWGRFRP